MRRLWRWLRGPVWFVALCAPWVVGALLFGIWGAFAFCGAAIAAVLGGYWVAGQLGSGADDEDEDEDEEEDRPATITAIASGGAALVSALVLDGNAEVAASMPVFLGIGFALNALRDRLRARAETP